MTWDMAREMQENGLVELGGHTHTHPVLGRCETTVAAREIEQCRQRMVAALFSWTMGPVLGAATVNDLYWSIYTGLAIAAVVPTVTYDIIALTKAFLRQVQDDPRSWVTILKDTLVAALSALLPWRK